MIELINLVLFPLAILLSAVATSIGVGGAIFFTPIFILFFKINPVHAVMLGLIVEIFSLISGVSAYWKEKSINLHIVKKMIFFTIPATIIGVIIVKYLSQNAVLLFISAVLFYVAFIFLIEEKKALPRHPEHTGAHTKHKKHVLDSRVKQAGFFGAIFTGITSTGLGEIDEYMFLTKMGLPIPSASGTSMMIVLISAIVAFIAHLTSWSVGDTEILLKTIWIIIITIPGVVIGAQVGARLSHKINLQTLSTYAGALFFILALLTLYAIF